jgi:signal transduction histidine kinase
MMSLAAVRSIFSVPNARDGDVQRRGELILQATVIAQGALLLVLATVPDDPTSWSPWTLMSRAGLVVNPVAFYLAKRARIEAASILVTIWCLLLMLAAAVFSGPGSNRMGSVVECILFIGCVADTWVTIAFGGAFAAFVAVLATAESIGLFTPLHVVLEPPWAPFLRQIIGVGVLVTVLRRGYDRLHRQVAERERSAAAAVASTRSLNASLERLVEERTRALSTARNRLSGLAGDLADHLTADLANMRDRLQAFLVREAELGAERLADVATAEEAAERLAAMIVRLHQHANLGKSGLCPSAIDMTTLVNAVVEEYRRADETGPVDWKIDALPPAWADEALIRTVVENLTGNALKFSKGRTPARIHIGFEPESQRYFVRDNGVGFDPRRTDKLFRPFQRLHREDEFEGYGLGLANVKRIIERSGGDVAADGVVGQGAVVYFRLQPVPEKRP